MRTLTRVLLASLLASTLAAVLAVAAAPAGATAAGQVADDPLLPPLPTAPEGDIAGVNDWECRTTAARPTPVVLVHGTFGDRRHLLENLGRGIKAAGFCVYSLDYGNRGTGDVRDSARQLAEFVGRVRRATGAARVSMVGHSQGGMMPRYYIKRLGGADVVDDLVGIAPSNHGTRIVMSQLPIADLVPGLVCRSCVQQAADSDFLRRLNHGDETPGPVSYTQITTRYDEVVVPHTSGYLEDGPRTTNITLQDLCPSLLTEHLFIPTHRTTVALTLDALTRPGPARASYRPGC